MKVGILGYFGAGNLGDEAVVQVVIAEIRKRWPHALIQSICLNPDECYHRHGITGFPIRRLPGNHDHLDQSSLSLGRRILRRLSTIAPAELVFLIKAYRWLRGFKLILVGGSGQLIDNEGGPWNHAYNHFKWTILARLVGAKFAFVSVGTGPVETALGRFFLGTSLKLGHYRSFRDRYSLQLAEAIGVRKNNHLYPDQAFMVAINNGLAKPTSGGKPIIGIAPIAYFDPRHWNEIDQDVYQEYVKTQARFTEWLIEQEYPIVFFHTQVDGDDRTIFDISKQIREDGVDVENLTKERIVRTPQDAFKAISSVDVVVASRFHAILFSYLHHRPVLGISYHQKIDDLMREFGQGDYTIDIAKVDLETMKEKMKRLLAERSDAQRRVEETGNIYRSKLSEQYDQVFGLVTEEGI